MQLTFEEFDDTCYHYHLLAMMTMEVSRNVLGTRNLGEILSQRDSIAMEMQVNIIIMAMVVVMMIAIGDAG